MASYKELVKEYRKLAKRADQRLVRLETLSYEKGYVHVKEWAYQRAMHDIKVYDENATRFNIKPPQTKSALERKIASIKNFLSSASSTKKGIKETYEKRVASINQTLRTNFSVDDFQKAMESGLVDRLKKDYGYRTAIEVIDRIQRDKESLENIVNDAKKQSIKIMQSDKWDSLGYDMIMKQTIAKELESQGLSLLDLK